ncbi:uncharacterized protein LOC143279342 [Babylonia areolata]|uniref:uncharacterized protein LOC143279342 n=1 Tax=Babylonia areolata TaxID=304850 RepID=UPI003FCF8468
MGNRSNLYVVCALLFPLAFVAFVVGFGCPVWRNFSDDSNTDMNAGLWQACKPMFESCTKLDFDDVDWMIGVRAVEIFALVMFVAAAADVLYENCCTKFRGRPLSERLATGITSILGGLGGLAGIIVYVVKTMDAQGTFGWAFALVTGGSGLAILLGVGFCVSGFFYEKNPGKTDPPKGQINGRAPHLTSNNEDYRLSAFTSRNSYNDEPGSGAGPLTAGDASGGDNLPGFAIYNGMLNTPGQRSSLPAGAVATPFRALPAPSLNGRGMGGGAGGAGLPAIMPKNPQYYSLSDDRALDPSFDLSEGFSSLPPKGRPRPRGQDNPAFSMEPPYRRGAGVPQEDPYVRRGDRGEDPYNRRGDRVEDPYNRRGDRVEDPYNRRGDRVEDPYNRRGDRIEDPRRGGDRSENPYNRRFVEEDAYSRANNKPPPRAGYNDPYGFDRLPGQGPGYGPGGDAPYDRANFGGGGLPMKDSYYNRGRF